MHRSRTATALLALALALATPRALLAGGCPDFDHTHEAWSRVLAARAAQGGFDYAGIVPDEREALGTYLAGLGACTAADYAAWSDGERMAFLINAYNAQVVKLVLDHHPLRSIRDIGLLPNAAFRRRFIELPALSPGRISLDYIEHERLRPDFADARIHFAVNCAAVACPSLRGEAYVAARLDAQLREQGEDFLADAGKNRLEGGVARLSKIFEWFAEDFVRDAGSVAAYAADYAPAELAAHLRGAAPRIEYLDYDWSLNQASRAP